MSENRMVSLQTLGGASLYRSGTQLRLPKKCVALLALLCDARGRPVARTKLTTMLWSDSRDRAARHSLNQALYTLRRLLGSAGIATTESSIQLTAEIDADFVELEKALARGEDGRIDSLARGPFLESYEFSDALAFVQWREQKAATLDAKLRLFTAHRVRKALDGNEPAEAEHIATAGIDKFPEDLGLRLGLIEARLRQSKPDEAHSAYVELKEFARTMEALNDIPSWDALSRASPAATPIGGKHTPPFVGRRAELAIVAVHWRRACDGEGNVVLVRGKAGMGKTFFSNQCVRLLKGARVLRATAYEAEQRIGFSMLAELFRLQIASADVRTLPPIMQMALQHIAPDLELAPQLADWPKLGHEAGERRVFDAAARALIAISNQEPVLVVLDDLQWIDDASRAWLEYFVRQIDRQRILVVGICRDGYPVGLALEQVDQISLCELTEIEIRALLQGLTKASPDQRLVAEVFRVTAGHPFYTVVVGSRLAKGLPIEIPQINQQVDQLTSSERRTVGLLAVLGTPTRIDHLANLTDRPVEELSHELRRLSALCTVRDDGTVGMAHDLVRASIYSRLPDSLRTALHVQIAQSFEGRLDTVGLAAEHWSKAGDNVKTTQLALRAASESELKHAAGAACHFYHLALSNERDPASKHQITKRLADLLFASAQFDLAIPYLRELAESEPNESVAIGWRWKHLYSRLGMRLVDPYELVSEARSLEELADRLNNAEALYHALRAQVVVECRQMGDHRLTRQNALLLELSRQHARTSVGAMALRFVADHVAATEDAYAGLAHARIAWQWAERIGEPELMIECLRALAMTQYFCGEVREARATMLCALGVVERTGAVLYRSLILPKLISVVTELDARAETEEYLESAVTSGTLRDGNDFAMALANRAILCYHVGEYAECIEVCNAAATANRAGSWLEVGVRGVLGLCLLEIGSVRDAMREADFLRGALSTTSVIAGDISYPLMLIARIAGLRRSESQVEGLIRSKHEQYARRDYVCRRRIQLALAETLARRSPAEARSLAEEVVREAEDRGLKALCDQGCATLRRIRRKNGNGFVQ